MAQWYCKNALYPVWNEGQKTFAFFVKEEFEDTLASSPKLSAKLDFLRLFFAHFSSLELWSILKNEIW